jgi:hypothetical protein
MKGTKIGTRNSFRSQDNIAFLTHVSTEPTTFVEEVEHKE